MDAAVNALGKGSRVWFKASDSSWQLADIKERSAAGKYDIVLVSSGQLQQNVEPEKIVPANPDIQARIEDLTQLSYLNEPSILHDLWERYQEDAVYTNAGPVLIAVNPCKSLPLYTSEVAQQYKSGAREALHRLSPHVFLVAGEAFRAMVREQTSQSLVINGESGAGKTETTKKAMQFFAALAGGTGVEDQVLETNPILEAFGNAKTLRNHNSSRFGKLIEIHFNQSHHICGARIRTYLLEKSRVVYQLKGERSYHIFYQMVRGASKEQRASWRLPTDVKDFSYLNQSGCTSIDGVDDAADFHTVVEALTDVGIDSDQQQVLFSTLAGVLWMGNLKITPNHSTDSSAVAQDAALASAAELLGLKPADLAHAITHKKIRTRDELIVKPLTADEAVDARDALAKAIYAGVFSWIVSRINFKLDSGKRGCGLYIAILDIYGFEQFQTNSFEQLCINYANERLQQQFTRHLFTLEQEEYTREGIDWTKVEWVDNQASLDVIEAMPPKGLGVLAVLDSQCKFPKASDDTFMQALKDNLTGKSSQFSTSARRMDEFTINHYAGPVNYSIHGFLDKNKDTLNADLIDLMMGSSNMLLGLIGGSTFEEAENSQQGSSSKSSSGQTVSSKFGQQLKELIAELDGTGLHFIRCIKPNIALQADKFDQQLVLSQLRCCGVLEVARVSRAGFPTRYLHADFVSRYRILLPKEHQAALKVGKLDANAAKAAVQQLLAQFKVAAGQSEMGRTKVFFRPGVLGQVEDHWAKMQSSILLMQSCVRMHLARSRFLAVRSAALAVQAYYRGRNTRRQFADELARHRAAGIIQRQWKGARQRQRYNKMRQATLVIQAAVRRRAFNRRVDKRVQARKAREAVAAAAAEQKRLAEEGFMSLKKEYGITELSEVKAALACYSTMKAELDSRDPGQVQAALQLYARVSAAGLGENGQLDAAELTNALKLQAMLCKSLKVAKPQEVRQEAVQQQLALAAAAQQVAGQAAQPQEVQELLQEAMATRKALSSSSVPPQELPQLLQEAVVTRKVLSSHSVQPQELDQQLQEAAATRKVLSSNAVPVKELDQLLQEASATRKVLSSHSMPPQELDQLLREAAVITKVLSSHSVPPQELDQLLQESAATRKVLSSHSVPPEELDQLLQEALAARRALSGDTGAASRGLGATANGNQSELHSVLHLAAALRRGGVRMSEDDAPATAELLQALKQRQISSSTHLDALLSKAAAADGLEPHQVASAVELQEAVVSCSFDPSQPQKVAAALQLAVAAQQGGAATAKELSQRLELAAAVRQAGLESASQAAAALSIAAAADAVGVSSADSLRTDLALGAAARQAGATDPRALTEGLAVAAAAEAAGCGDSKAVAEAVAWAAAAREAGAASEQQLTRALAVAAAAERAGLTDEAALEAAVTLAAVAKQSGIHTAADLATALEGRATAAAAAEAGLGGQAQVATAAAMLAVATSAGLTEPAEVAAAVALYQKLKENRESVPEPRIVKRAVLMYAEAQGCGMSDRKEFMKAAELYQAMREEHMKVPEVKSALMLFVALREEGIVAPAEIQAAVACYTALKSELGSGDVPVDAEEVRRAVRLYHQSGNTPPSNASSYQRFGNGVVAEGEAGVVISELQRQLASEKAARQRYAQKLEAQAAEWMMNVRGLKATIDTLKARIPPGGLPGGTTAAAGSGDGAAAGMAPTTPLSPPAPGAYVGRLRADMTDKAPKFNDDVSFIVEVASGDASAPNMDAQEELDRLRLKHDAWNREFKEKLRVAQAALRQKRRSGGGGQAAAAPAGAASRINVNSMPDLEAFDPDGSPGEMQEKKKGGLFGVLRR